MSIQAAKSSTVFLWCYSVLYTNGKQETLFLTNVGVAAFKRRKNFRKEVLDFKKISMVSVSTRVVMY